eukprot:569764-Rhodomonas_salina.1
MDDELLREWVVLNDCGGGVSVRKSVVGWMKDDGRPRLWLVLRRGEGGEGGEAFCLANEPVWG